MNNHASNLRILNDSSYLHCSFEGSIFFQLLEEIITMVTKSRLKYLETYIALFLGKIISNSETVSTKYKVQKTI